MKSYSTNSGLGGAQTIAKSETEARKQLNRLQERMNQLEELFGVGEKAESMDVDERVKDLTGRLEKKDKEVKNLKAHLNVAEQVGPMILTFRWGVGHAQLLTFDKCRLFYSPQSKGMLCAEIEQLSQAWQTLDVQNRDKVFNLVQLEEKVTKYASEVSCLSLRGTDRDD